MQISQIIGGYTLGGADMLRRAMGKKKPEEMAKHRETIAEGAKGRGYDPALAEKLFDLMTKFAEYGFNKSHTAAYAVVTYHTAWLKRYHCAAFMAATMSSDMDNTDTVKIFYEDTIANKVTVLGPDVNACFWMNCRSLIARCSRPCASPSKAAESILPALPGKLGGMKLASSIVQPVLPIQFCSLRNSPGVLFCPRTLSIKIVCRCSNRLSRRGLPCSCSWASINALR